jgi:hypothetical protein
MMAWPGAFGQVKSHSENRSEWRFYVGAWSDHCKAFASSRFGVLGCLKLVYGSFFESFFCSLLGSGDRVEARLRDFRGADLAVYELRLGASKAPFRRGEGSRGPHCRE